MAEASYCEDNRVVARDVLFNARFRCAPCNPLIVKAFTVGMVGRQAFILTYVDITHITHCNIELINQSQAVNNEWTAGYWRSRMPMLHLLRANGC